MGHLVRGADRRSPVPPSAPRGGRYCGRKGGDKYNPLTRYAPALLTLEGVREIAFEGRYQLNTTLVDIEARALPDDGETIEFVFDLTGGRDADAYFVKLRIVRKGFALGPG
jgi:hypothetical protein